MISRVFVKVSPTPTCNERAHERADPHNHVSVLPGDLPVDQGSHRSVRRSRDAASSTGAPCSRACEETVERLARDPRYFARPERALFADIRRYFPITAQAQVSWAVSQGIGAAVDVRRRARSRAGAFDGGAARCQATTRKGKPCQRTPLPEREYCPSHQHLEAGRPPPPRVEPQRRALAHRLRRRWPRLRGPAQCA